MRDALAGMRRLRLFDSTKFETYIAQVNPQLSSVKCQPNAPPAAAWGLLNAVTEYVDHERRARSVDYRLDSAWFGPGAGIKQRALDAALELVA